jgi:transmembrane sensor
MADERVDFSDERLEQELSLARRAAPVFGLGRQQQVIWGVRRRLQRAPLAVRRLLPLVAAASLFCELAAAYVWFGAPAEELTRSARDEHWELRDGSRIVIETPNTQITKRRESSTEVVFELKAGAARFDVAHRPERAFRVQAGPVQVEVIGTKFRVERRDDRTEVSVERGRVRVAWPGDSTELSVGEHGVYPPPLAVASARAPASAAPPANATSTNTEPLPLASARQTSAARNVASEPAAHTPSAEELFTTADHARAEGRPEDAARTLRELLQQFPHDGRAPLAAFTLGRLLLERLGQPAEAARAFAQARALAGGSSALAEDALAREADAWRAAGRSGEAARAATLYRTKYPHGTHLKEALRASESPSP